MASSPATTPTASGPEATAALEALNALLFKATNPANKAEDVNTIKQFCDAVTAAQAEGPVIACRILAHKIQSPQEREAVQALAVLEACTKSCGPAFHAEIGKFKFLNEMIKLVSPRYLAGRTPEHIKKKVIELLYIWSKDIRSEPKIGEAYLMLKKQGIVKEDPAYVGRAVFAAALPPRNDNVMNAEEQMLLRKLLQSKNPDDLQKANKIIRNMVKEDERKMDALTRRSTELTMVNNNAKLLSEMLDHYDRTNAGREELELLKELFQSCEKMQPKLFRLAAETDEHDDGIGEILQASDEIARVIDRYKMVIVEGKPDVTRPFSSSSSAYLQKQHSDQLLDLDAASPFESGTDPTTSGTVAGADKSSQDSMLDDVMIGLGAVEVKPPIEVDNEIVSAAPLVSAPSDSLATNGKLLLTIDDLLDGPVDDPKMSGPPLVLPLSTNMSSAASASKANSEDSKLEPKSSRVRGLDELDFLGESALRAHLPQKSPQFAKKSEKLTMNQLAAKRSEFPAAVVAPMPPEVATPGTEKAAADMPSIQKVSSPVSVPPPTQINLAEVIPAASTTVTANPATNVVEDVKIADLFVPLISIKPGSIPPLTLQESSDGISIVLHFGKDRPRDFVSAVVVTIISKLSEPITNFELKAVVPKGCKVKLQPPSNDSLPAYNPFAPPAAITQVMLIANPKSIPISLKYVLSYMVDDEPQTEMGAVESLPI